MAEEDVFWIHAGISEIGEEDGSYRVRVPDRVFRDERILKLGRYVNWHYNKVTGILIVTHDYLEKEDYEYTEESTKFTEGDSEFKLTVPKLFFEDGQGVRGTGVEPEFSQAIEVPREGFLHFVYNREMSDSETKSCYVLTEEQFDARFADSDHFDGSMQQAPMFFS